VNREITLRDYLRVAWSGRWLILATTVVGVLVGILLTVARSPVYTATARVYLGQATTISGTPVQTPFTNPTTAPLALDSDAIVRRVARAVDVTPGRVRDAVDLSTTRVTGSQGNLPTVLTVTSTDGSRRVAIEIANRYAAAVLAQAGQGFRETRRVYVQQVARTTAEAERLSADAARLRRNLVSAGPAQAPLLQAALTSVVVQLEDVQQSRNDAEIQLRKADQIEAPQPISAAESAGSSGAAPRRLQSVVLAGLVGFLIGVIATFVWRGSPAARAAEPGATDA
jgi:uncharacterized protein involved in exopolysaccharide biosynthesis